MILYIYNKKYVYAWFVLQTISARFSNPIRNTDEVDLMYFNFNSALIFPEYNHQAFSISPSLMNITPTMPCDTYRFITTGLSTFLQ